jgi:hypothetical protein
MIIDRKYRERVVVLLLREETAGEGKKRIKG